MISFLNIASQIQGITFVEKQRIGINGNRIEKIENWAISVGFTPDKIS
jgi:hypothetical protein|nr:MAG TPA: hypothetical protein [Caudoviricetes sp.]